MVKKYVNRIDFESLQDFRDNFKLIVPETFNFAYDVVDEWAKTHPTKTALTWVNDRGEHHNFSFQAMQEESDKAAAAFLSLGIKKGDKVMLILKRRYHYWFAILGLHKIGAVAIPATHLLRKKDIIYRCEAASVSTILCVESMCEAVDEAEKECSSLVHKLYINDPEPTLYTVADSAWCNLTDLMCKAPAFDKKKYLEEVKITNDDLMLLYFTSGTTQEPKIVAHNYTYPLGHIITAGFWQNLREESLHLTVADTGWAKAAWGKLYGQWLMGATVFVYDHEKFHVPDLLKMLQDYKVTSFCAPPTVYRFMILEDLSQYNFSALKYCEVAGEPINQSVIDAFKAATGLTLMQGFGQTETTVSICNFPWMQAKAGSMGVPSPAYDIDLLTGDGRSAAVGEHGEIVFYTQQKKPVGLFMGTMTHRDLLTKCIIMRHITPAT